MMPVKLSKQSNKQMKMCVTGICDSEITPTKYQFGVEGVLLMIVLNYLLKEKLMRNINVSGEGTVVKVFILKFNYENH